MNNWTRLSLLLFVLLISSKLSSQDSYFQEFDVDADIWTKKNWTISLSGSYQFTYDNSHWNRLGGNASVAWQLGPWRLLGGYSMHYTFGKPFRNYYELRPWVGLRLSTIVIQEKLWFNQTAKAEWRNFLYSKGEKYDNYERLRYKIDSKYLFKKNLEKNTQWYLQAYAEWYLLQNPSSGEVFPNSREFGVTVGYINPKNRTITASLQLDGFYANDQGGSGNGYNFVLGYIF